MDAGTAESFWRNHNELTRGGAAFLLRGSAWFTNRREYHHEYKQLALDEYRQRRGIWRQSGFQFEHYNGRGQGFNWVGED